MSAKVQNVDPKSLVTPSDSDNTKFKETEMELIDEALATLDSTRHMLTPSQSKGQQQQNNGSWKTSKSGNTPNSKTDKMKMANNNNNTNNTTIKEESDNDDSNSHGNHSVSDNEQQTAEHIVMTFPKTNYKNKNESNDNDAESYLLAVEESRTIISQSRQAKQCNGIFKWIIIIACLIACIIYLAFGYINEESITRIEFEEITYVAAPLVYTQFIPQKGGLSWVSIDSIWYYNLTSQNYETFSLLDDKNKALQGIKYFEFSLNDSNVSDIIENYNYMKYCDYWVIICDKWQGYNKLHKIVIIPPRDVAMVNDDTNVLKIGFRGEYQYDIDGGNNNDDENTLLSYVYQNEDLFGFYWSLEEVLSFLDNNEKEENGLINWKTVNVKQNGYLSFPKNKWFYLLPIYNENEINDESFMYYDLRTSSEALTSNIYTYNKTKNDGYYYYLNTYMSLSVDPLSKSTRYVIERKYSTIELLAIIGGVYALIASIVSGFCIKVVIKHLYPKSFMFDDIMNRSLTNYLKLYEFESDNHDTNNMKNKQYTPVSGVAGDNTV